MKVVLISICLLVLSGFGQVEPAIAASHIPAYEQSLVGTVTVAQGVVVRANPNRSAAQIGVLDGNTRVLVTGRNEGNSWLHIQSPVGNGYVPVDTLKLRGDLSRLPVVPDNLPVSTLPPQTPVSDPKKYPILPSVSAYTKAIYQRGLQAGNRREIFSKVGDCMTADLQLFLGRFGTRYYYLGKYKSLQPLITYYGKVSPRRGAANSFLAQSMATHTGFNASSVEDATWASPVYCAKGETPLACEYRLSRPSVALIMFGTNDIMALTPTEFDFYLRLVVFDTIDHGIIPLLSTFPGDPWREKETHRFNQIIFQIARDYDVPVMNLWLAIQPLLYHGRNYKSSYLSRTLQTRVSYFTPYELRYGYTMRNLITLQALDIVWRGVIQKS